MDIKAIHPSRAQASRFALASRKREGIYQTIEHTEW